MTPTSGHGMMPPPPAINRLETLRVIPPSPNPAAPLRDAARSVALAAGLAVALLALPLPALADADADTDTAAGSEAPLPALSFGTGGITGLYFPAGGALAAVLAEHGVTLHVESTGGSMENLVRLHHGDLDLAIAESDRVHQAMLGTGPFERGEPFGALRTLFALHPEPLTILVQADSPIADLADLADRTVNAGPDTSPAHILLSLAFETLEIAPEGFAEIDPAIQAEALCAGEIDAAAFVSGHPNGLLRAAFDLCALRLLPVGGGTADALVQGHPYLAATEIPGGLYPGIDEPVATLGPVALVMTTADLPDDVAYAITLTACREIEGLRLHHPVLSDLSVDGMLGDGMAAPLHPGAVRYFTEAGMM